MKNCIYLLFALLFFGSVHSQEVSGKVTDDKGIGIPNVNIQNTVTNFNIVSDFDGNFKIKANNGDQLKFSFIGYTTKMVNASAEMTIILVEEVNMMNEVIVVGYGTKKAGSITGSVSQIKSADILKTPSQNAIQAIQGKAAGVNIVTNDEPGANPSIRIRGLGTLLGGRDPLYIIDGIEATSLNGLSPNEIATFDILKDASSLAIYGQKGSNGVVVVTTKKGKGAIKVNYDAYYGQKYIQREVKMSDSYRYAYYNNSALGSSSYFNFNQPYNTNWLDEITSVGVVMR